MHVVVYVLFPTCSCITAIFLAENFACFVRYTFTIILDFLSHREPPTIRLYWKLCFWNSITYRRMYTKFYLINIADVMVFVCKCCVFDRFLVEKASFILTHNVYIVFRVVVVVAASVIRGEKKKKIIVSLKLILALRTKAKKFEIFSSLTKMTIFIGLLLLFYVWNL